MEEEKNTGGGQVEGESPETLSRLQIILAHLLLVGVPLAFLSSQMPGIRAPLILMVVAAGLGVAVTLPSLASLPRLRPFEWTSLAVVAAACAALAALGITGLLRGA